MTIMLLIGAGMSSYAAFACFALAMPDHWQQAGGEPAAWTARRRGLRPSGTALLALAYALCAWRDGAAFGSLLWAMLASAGALAVAFTLTWRPRLLLPGRRRTDS